MKCLDVVKEEMQEVGAREDEVFGESPVATSDRKTEKKKKKNTITYTCVL